METVSCNCTRFHDRCRLHVKIRLNSYACDNLATEERIYKQEGCVWRAFPVCRVRTSARHGIAKYRWSAEVTRIRPHDLIPASVDHTKTWVLKVATMEILERPVADLPPTTDAQEIL
jgi:hypothetical protein